MPATIEELTQRVSGYWPGVDKDMLIRAYNFADHAHHGQLRKSGEPFIYHPLNVGYILSHVEADPPSVLGGLLHDTIEDTGVTLEDIEESYGPVVAHLVEGVTKLSNLNFRTQKEEQARNLRKMFLAMSQDVRVILIKIADRLHNMRTLDALPKDRQQHIAEETRMVFAPLAHRLGVWRFKWELEDLSLRYLEPAAYFDIVDRLGKTRSERERDIEKARLMLEERLHEAGINAVVRGRPKHVFSIHTKMRVQQLDFEQIGDLMALRVIGETVGDCYAALGVVHDLWMPLAGQFTDYIAKPKSNKYRSLHTKVLGPNSQPMEVQIRTQEMHKLAEYGIAAHWRYKEGGGSDPDLDEHIGWLRQLLDLETDLKESHEFLELLHIDLFKDQVFVFTPQGDVIDLPAGATPIDFAYRVHTEVGHRTVGAKVNGRLVSLDYKFTNGDVAEIVTQSSAQPSRDWLDVAQSSHAKAKIRRFLRQQSRDENIERGRATLTREIARLKGSQRAELDMSRLAWVAEHLNYLDAESLHAAIGYGDVEPSTVIKHLERPKEPGTLAEEVAQFSPGRLASGAGTPQVTSDGVKGFQSRLSKCCNPLPGDDIVGYITRGGGLAIHRSDCKNLSYRQQKEPERVLALSWDADKGQSILSDIEVVAVDRVGLFSHITAVISDMGLSIRAAEAHMLDEHLARLTITVEIQERKDLDELLEHLSDLIDVVSARPLSTASA